MAILRISMQIVSRSLRKDSIEYQKVNENEMKDLKLFKISFPLFHFAQSIFVRAQKAIQNKHKALISTMKITKEIQI